MILPRRGWVLVLVTMGGALLRGQQSTDTVPKELMTVLLRGATGMPGQPFDLRVGPAPADFPKDLLPPGTVVGVTAISDRMTTVVGTDSDLTTGARLKEPDRLAESGWVSVMPVRRGFVASTPEFPLSVCRGTDFATITFVDRPESGSFVRASVSKDPRRSCVARPEMSFPDVPIPALTPPVGVKSYGGNGGGTLDSFTSDTRLDTTQSPKEIAEHYAKQLEAAGWKTEGDANNGRQLAVTRLTVQSKSGDPVTAVLTVTVLHGTSYLDVMLHIIRNGSANGRGGSSSLIIR